MEVESLRVWVLCTAQHAMRTSRDGIYTPCTENMVVLTPQRGSVITIVVTLAENLPVLSMVMSSSGMAQHAGMNKSRTCTSTDQEHLVAASVQSSREIDSHLCLGCAPGVGGCRSWISSSVHAPIQRDGGWASLMLGAPRRLYARQTGTSTCAWTSSYFTVHNAASRRI